MIHVYVCASPSDPRSDDWVGFNIPDDLATRITDVREYLGDVLMAAIDELEKYDDTSD